MNKMDFMLLSLLAMLGNDENNNECNDNTCNAKECLNESNNIIDSLTKNLNTLDVDKSGVVTASLTISGVQFKFVKVLGEWGVMCANGSWEPFRIIPMGAVEQMADIVQNVANLNTK